MQDLWRVSNKVLMWYIVQPLTVLKDVISCQSDYLIYDDCSDNPSEDVQKYVFELGKQVWIDLYNLKLSFSLHSPILVEEESFRFLFYR